MTVRVSCVTELRCWPRFQEEIVPHIWKVRQEVVKDPILEALSDQS